MVVGMKTHSAQADRPSPGQDMRLEGEVNGSGGVVGREGGGTGSKWI